MKRGKAKTDAEMNTAKGGKAKATDEATKKLRAFRDEHATQEMPASLYDALENGGMNGCIEGPGDLAENHSEYIKASLRAAKQSKKRKPSSPSKISTKSAKPKTDAEARALAIRNGWGPMLKRFPDMGKA